MNKENQLMIIRWWWWWWCRCDEEKRKGTKNFYFLLEVNEFVVFVAVRKLIIQAHANHCDCEFKQSTDENKQTNKHLKCKSDH